MISFLKFLVNSTCIYWEPIGCLSGKPGELQLETKITFDFFAQESRTAVKLRPLNTWVELLLIQMNRRQGWGMEKWESRTILNKAQWHIYTYIHIYKHIYHRTITCMITYKINFPDKRDGSGSKGTCQQVWHLLWNLSTRNQALTECLKGKPLSKPHPVHACMHHLITVGLRVVSLGCFGLLPLSPLSAGQVSPSLTGSAPCNTSISWELWLSSRHFHSVYSHSPNTQPLKG